MFGIRFVPLKKSVLVLLLGFTLSTSLTACDDGLSFNVSEQQIESRIAGYFPYHKEALMGQVKLDIRQPDLILKAGSDRAELALQTVVTAAGRQWPGKLRLSFGVDYAADTGTFYLIEPRIEDASMDAVPTQISGAVVQYLLPLVQQYLTRVPVYTLKPENSNTQDMARKTLKHLAFQNGSLKVTLGWVDQKKQP